MGGHWTAIVLSLATLSACGFGYSRVWRNDDTLIVNRGANRYTYRLNRFESRRARWDPAQPAISIAPEGAVEIGSIAVEAEHSGSGFDGLHRSESDFYGELGQLAARAGATHFHVSDKSLHGGFIINLTVSMLYVGDRSDEARSRGRRRERRRRRDAERLISDTVHRCAPNTHVTIRFDASGSPTALRRFEGETDEKRLCISSALDGIRIETRGAPITRTYPRDASRASQSRNHRSTAPGTGPNNEADATTSATPERRTAQSGAQVRAILDSRAAGIADCVAQDRVRIELVQADGPAVASVGDFASDSAELECVRHLLRDLSLGDQPRLIHVIERPTEP